MLTKFRLLPHAVQYTIAGSLFVNVALATYVLAGLSVQSGHQLLPTRDSNDSLSHKTHPMKYKIGDYVILTAARIYPNGDTLRKGTAGRVVSVRPYQEAYAIDFDQTEIPHIIPESILEDIDCCEFFNRNR
ncbi:hypothetical protein [Flavobacterium sp.]|uniref:hypothetical protein n=1 Tax=Flavobacterium sp. TaxID=239 RepID=UPI0026229125|nr:hypothetical protein [Flavobacterium sp.]